MTTPTSNQTKKMFPEVPRDAGIWRKVGEIGVDVGMCWIGDPSYILFKTAKTRAKSLGNSWDDFIGAGDDGQFNYDHGAPGLGVCVSTGYGDGTYPVEARIVDGRVAEVRIVFIDAEQTARANAAYERCIAETKTPLSLPEKSK